MYFIRQHQFLFAIASFVMLQINHFYAVSHIGYHWVHDGIYSSNVISYLITFHTFTTCLFSIYLSTKLKHININHAAFFTHSMTALACLMLLIHHPLILYTSFFINALACSVSLFSLSNLLNNVTSQERKSSLSVIITLSYTFSPLLSTAFSGLLTPYISLDQYFLVGAACNIVFAFILMFLVEKKTYLISQQKLNFAQYFSVFQYRPFALLWFSMAVLYSIVIYYVISYHGFLNIGKSIDINEHNIYILVVISHLSACFSKYFAAYYCKKPNLNHRFYQLCSLSICLALLLVILLNRLNVWYLSYVFFGITGGLTTPVIFLASLMFKSKRQQLCARSSVTMAGLLAGSLVSLYILIDGMIDGSTLATSSAFFMITLIVYLLLWRFGLFMKNTSQANDQFLNDSIKD